MNINVVSLTGRVTADVEMRTSKDGKNFVNFDIAVGRYANGEEETDFFKCTAFGKTAENIGNYVKKGNKISVLGQLRTNSYENNQGQKITKTFVMVTTFDNHTYNQDASSRGNSNSYKKSNYNNNNTYGGTTSYDVNSYADEYTGTLDISSDDLPF